MILVTGGTGFVGRALIRNLVTMGRPVRTLLRPSQRPPNLPRGVPVEVAVCSITDARGLRAAMKEVDVVYHLIGDERAGASRADLTKVDIESTQMVSEAAAEAGVRRFVYLSRLGADRASAFPLLKAKALAESAVTQHGMGYTILRSAAIYGPGDQFLTAMARLIRLVPFFFFMPGDGSSLLQPIWIEDLVTCLAWVIEDEQFDGQIITVGGGEYLSFREIVDMLMETLGRRRSLVSVPPAYLRMIGLWIDQFYTRLPVSTFWLDTLAVDRTTALDTLPRLFGLMPARLSQQIKELKDELR
jgi:nucleoside-diphosphate-sugar epimerase